MLPGVTVEAAPGILESYDGSVLNTNYPLTYDNGYDYSAGNVEAGGTWNDPTSIYAPRFVRLNFTVNF